MVTSVERQLVLFTITTGMISWPLFYLSGVLSVRPESFSYDARWLIAQIGVFGPSISALLISSTRSRDLRRNGLRVFSLFILIFIVGIVITHYQPRSIQDFPPLVSMIVVTVGVASLLFFSPLNRHLLVPATGETQGQAAMKGIVLAVLGLPFLFLVGWFIVNIPGNRWAVAYLNNGPTRFAAMSFTAFFMNLIFGGSMGEELGWRGFALPLLLRKYAPLQASYVLGLMQAFWHLPSDISGADLGAIGAVLLRIGWSIPITIIFTWFYLKFGGKLLIAILLHTAVNVLPDLGFSNYDSSILVLALILVIISITVARTPCMRNRAVLSQRIE